MEFVVELPSACHRIGRLPGACVRVDGIVEDLCALIGNGVGPCGATKQRQTKNVADGIIAVLGVVEQAQAVAAIALVSPAQCGDFEAGLFETVVASGWTLDGSVGNLVGGVFVCRREREGSFEEDNMELF